MYDEQGGHHTYFQRMHMYDEQGGHHTSGEPQGVHALQGGGALERLITLLGGGGALEPFTVWEPHRGEWHHWEA
jgi:hypothetical protein